MHQLQIEFLRRHAFAERRADTTLGYERLDEETVSNNYHRGMVRVQRRCTGLVDEVGVVINPELVGGESPRTMFAAPNLTSAAGVIGLKLTHLERIGEDFAWLRYRASREEVTRQASLTLPSGEHHEG